MKTLKQILSECEALLETYQEGEDSTVTHEGKEYSLDVLFKETEGRTPEKIDVSLFEWILPDPSSKLSKEDRKRVKESSLKFPILYTIAKEDGRERYVPIDGYHRLIKAKENGIDKIKAIKINKQNLEKALVK